MTVLKSKKNIQWEKAKQRINVSPLVARISGCESKVIKKCPDFTFHLKNIWV